MWLALLIHLMFKILIWTKWMRRSSCRSGLWTIILRFTNCMGEPREKDWSDMLQKWLRVKRPPELRQIWCHTLCMWSYRSNHRWEWCETTQSTSLMMRFLPLMRWRFIEISCRRVSQPCLGMTRRNGPCISWSPNGFKTIRLSQSWTGCSAPTWVLNEKSFSHRSSTSSWREVLDKHSPKELLKRSTYTLATPISRKPTGKWTNKSI